MKDKKEKEKWMKAPDWILFNTMIDDASDVSVVVEFCLVVSKKLPKKDPKRAD